MTDSSFTLEQRLLQLEDVAAIAKLTATYGHYVDFGWDGKTTSLDRLPSVFAGDATWSSSATGVTTTGREQIVEMLAGAPGDLEFAMHSFTNPIIDVDGDTATGKFLLWVGIDGNEVFQSEDLTYIRTDAGWLIQSIDLRFGKMLNG